MKVAVYLGDIKPDVGGGFTFINDVAAAFLEHAQKSPHQFVLICSRAYAQAVAESGLPTNVEAAPIGSNRLLERALVAARHYLPLFGAVWGRPSLLDRICRQRGVDLIWFVGGFHDSPDTPFITTVWDVQHLTHPWFPEVSARWQWDKREGFLWRHLRRASHIITGTEIGKAELVRYYGLMEGKISLLRHPTPAFALRGAEVSYVPAATQPYFFYPAQFWAHKNHINLLDGYRRLLDVRQDAPDLIFVGSDKGTRARVSAYVERLDLAKKVQFKGFIPVEELLSLYKHAAAMVYASFSGPENLPPLEAFALGCPVVASDFPGAREQLGDAVTWFNPESAESIAEALAIVLDDGKARDAKVAKGLLRASAWTGGHYVQGVMGILDGLEHQARNWSTRPA